MKDRLADPLAPPTELGPEGPKVNRESFTQPATLTAALALIGAMYLARDILIPIVLALIFSFLVAPLVRLLQRARINQAVAVLVSVVVPLCIVVAIAGVVGSQIAEVAQSLPQYRETIDAKVKSLEDIANGKVGQFLGRAGQVIERVSSGEAPAVPGAAPSAARAVTGDAPAAAPAETAPAPAPSESHGAPLTLVGHFLSALLGPLATAFIVFIVSIFMLLERGSVRDRFIKLIGARDSARTTVALDDTATRLSRYFVSQLAINTSAGVVIGCGLAALGGPSPVLWGVLAALLRFIPYIGVWIAGVLACLLAAAIDPGWSMVFWTIGVFAVVELIAGQVVEPLLYGHTTGLSPLSVVVAAIFWSWLWGPVGLILSTPLTLCLVVLGRYVERLNFLEILLGDKPQVTPAQQLYEHLSEGDLEASFKQGRELIGTASAAAYYDDVLIPALRLLSEATDGRTLDHQQVRAARDTGLELVRELGPNLSNGASSPNAAASQHGVATRQVLCLAARAPFDVVMAAALVALFEANHLTVFKQFDASSLTTLPDGIKPEYCHVCIVSTRPSRSASGVQTAARRLASLFQGMPVLTGVYSEEETDDGTRDGEASTHAVQSVRELLDLVSGGSADAASKASAGMKSADTQRRQQSKQSVALG